MLLHLLAVGHFPTRLSIAGMFNTSLPSWLEYLLWEEGSVCHVMNATLISVLQAKNRLKLKELMEHHSRHDLIHHILYRNASAGTINAHVS